MPVELFVVMEPCRHVYFCAGCWSNHARINSPNTVPRCPICRSYVRRTRFNTASIPNYGVDNGNESDPVPVDFTNVWSRYDPRELAMEVVMPSDTSGSHTDGEAAGDVPVAGTTSEDGEAVGDVPGGDQDGDVPVVDGDVSDGDQDVPVVDIADVVAPRQPIQDEGHDGDDDETEDEAEDETEEIRIEVDPLIGELIQLRNHNRRELEDSGDDDVWRLSSDEFFDSDNDFNGQIEEEYRNLDLGYEYVVTQEVDE